VVSGRIGRVLLSDLAATSAGVARSPGRRDKIGQIASLLERAPSGEVSIAVAFLSGELTQRQIGVGYAALIGLPSSADDAVAGAAMEAVATLTGSAAEQAPAAEPALSLTETDAVFAEIGALAGPGSQAQRRSLLASLVARTTASEREFLVRLLAGDLGQGALEGVMADAVAKAAGVPAADVRRAMQLRGSLPEVARVALVAARDSGGPEAVTAALRRFTLQVGQPLRPMLAASAPDLDSALQRISPAALDWKIDGIRVQVHRSEDQVWVFTRTLDDITARVPEVVQMALDLPIRSVVIDGEAIALRPNGRPQPFQVTSARVASHSESAVPLTAFLFDALHIDGEDLIDQPASERFDRLAAIAPAGLLIPRIVTADPQLAADFFGDAISRGHEGVVAKALQAPYRAGRRGSDWIKVKPRVTLDLVILAAEWGHGRRTGLLSNLHLGARDPRTGGFVMLGKTFKGLTDAMLAWQTERLLALSDPPAARPTGGPGWQHGVVRVRPELVAEIAFDGVQASRRYPGGVALRFARVLRYREDKQAAEADTIDEVRALWPQDEAD
jgi:ATP-dependent DNA ligase I